MHPEAKISPKNVTEQHKWGLNCPAHLFGTCRTFMCREMVEKSLEEFSSSIHTHIFSNFFSSMLVLFPLYLLLFQTLPLSIASECPYTMTLMPQSHQRQIFFFYSCWRELANSMLLCNHWKKSELGTELLYKGKQHYTTGLFMGFKGQRSLMGFSNPNI